jgi:hypothetical protein
MKFTVGSLNMFDCIPKIKRYTRTLLLGAMCAAAQTSVLAEMPAVFWQSQPVIPGEIVAVEGHAFQSASTIEWQILPNSAPGSSPASVVLPTTGFTTGLVPTKIKPQQLNFVLPGTTAGVFAWRVKNPDNTFSTTRLLNGPEPWFMQADRGRRATQGGWFVIHGLQMQYGSGQAQVALMKNGVLQTILTARAGGNAYEQTFDVPLTLPAGTTSAGTNYELYIHNGSGGPNAWVKLSSTIFAKDADLTPRADLVVVASTLTWDAMARSKPIANIPSVLPPGKTWDDVFDTAIGTLQTNGGGVLNIPAGTFPMTRRIVLPNYTIMKGAGMSATILRWNSQFAPAANPFRSWALVSAKLLPGQASSFGTFSLEDLTLDRAYEDNVTQIKDNVIYTGPQGNDPPPSTPDLRLVGATCIERQNTGDDGQFAHFRRVSCSSPNSQQSTLDYKNSNSPIWERRAAVNLHWASSTEITGCVFDYPVGIAMNGDNGQRNAFVRIDGNQIYWRRDSLKAVYGTTGLRVAGNTITMRGSVVNNGFQGIADIGMEMGPFNNNICDIYIANNAMLRDATPPDPINELQLGFTTDSTTSAYIGHVQSVNNSTTQTLTGFGSGGITRNVNQYNQPPVQPGAFVSIVSGRGAGQWRELTSSATNVSFITIDRPWDVQPDATSWLTINDMQGRMLIVNNNLSNAPKLQLYFVTHDVVVANNQIGHGGVAAGFGIYRGMTAGNVYLSIIRSLHTQYLDNKIGANGLTFFDPAFPNFVASTTQGAYVDGATSSSLITDLNTYSAPLVFRRNQRVGTPVSGSQFLLSLNALRPGVLIDKNSGISQITTTLNQTEANPTNQFGVFLDNLPVGQQDSARTVTGLWCQSSSGNQLGADSLYNYRGISDNCGIATAMAPPTAISTYRWTPTVPNARNYDVYVWWSTHSNRSTSVPISVKYSGPTAAVRNFDENNATLGGQWVWHGRYNFNQGTSGYLEVSLNNGTIAAPGQQGAADAVLLMPVQ